jgi:hypothetical protein
MPRGQKTCPKCKLSCGPRTKICKCNYKFEFKAKKVYTKKDSAPIIKALRNFVYCARVCPIPLKNIKDIKNWLQKVQCLKSNGILYSRQAIISWLIDHKDRLEAIKYVKEHMNEYPDCIEYQKQLDEHIQKIYRTPRKRYV